MDTTRPRLIGLYSPYPFAGKTTVATFLAKNGFVPLKFAGPLKTMVSGLFHDLGFSPELAHQYIHGDKKEEAIEMLGGVTSRYIQQTLGTEWGRDCVHQDLWVIAAVASARRYLEDGYNVVFDDMRFPNEYDALKDAGAELWSVIRPNIAVYTGDHSSEGQLNCRAFDQIIFNGGTIEDLEEALSSLL